MSNFNNFTAHGYEVVRELGVNRGAGRIAYLAREIDSEQLVVIKQFQFAQTGSNWDGHKEIDREVKILQQLKHPNIPRYLSSFETPQSSCIVQEYIDGKPLSEIISNQQLYTPEQVKEIILKLLEVLVYLQKTFTDPVLHRDIKPANILIDSFCEPYLIDFGGAKVSEGAGGSTVSVGTAGFMTPEQKHSQFNKTTDIYSLGLTIVCWLTRTEPAEMYTIINSTNQVIGLKKLLSNYSLPFVNWLGKVVQPDHKDRYPDAEAALNAFKPLYVQQVPKAIISRSVLDFTASKLGEQITKTITVRNGFQDTVLEGWWEVAPHPSDPPCKQNSHAWISFGSSKFSGNDNKCSIFVNTSKLMAGKVYKRQILLHSNSLEETQEIELTIKTAKIPIESDYLPYVNLIYLLFVTGGITSFSTIYLTAFIAIITVIPGLIISGIGIVLVLAIWISTIYIINEKMLWEEGGCAGLGCGTIVLFFVAQFIAQSIYRSSPQIFEFDSLNRHGDAIVPLLAVVILCCVLVLIIKIIINGKGKASLLKIAILLSIIAGVSIPLFYLIGSQSIVFSVALFATSVPLASTLLYPTVKQKKLISKYRDSERKLIKP